MEIGVKFRFIPEFETLTDFLQVYMYSSMRFKGLCDTYGQACRLLVRSVTLYHTNTVLLFRSSLKISIMEDFRTFSQ